MIVRYIRQKEHKWPNYFHFARDCTPGEVLMRREGRRRVSAGGTAMEAACCEEESRSSRVPPAASAPPWPDGLPEMAAGRS